MTADEFRNELAGLFEAAADAGRGTIVVRAGDLHRSVGGYPGTNHPPDADVLQRDVRGDGRRR